MNFCEAMVLLKSGSKITRNSWKGDVYFKMVGQDVKSFQPQLNRYYYNEDIMTSTGWMVNNEDGTYTFAEIIPLLLNGYKIKLRDWNEKYIFLDINERYLVLHSMEICAFTPDFDSFIADDWIELTL
ncbi:hypothetical protein UFOVP100_15 [uncultured Caudovirales phage]|uniref:Thoeris anti-defense 2-like domain-containing protein n=1 Tax=uncultured Caudovirales phage TaxID=2100421 RepID=A0A6J5L4R7_9CAUD|nr:hypothetical protein UFOVP100_15 [uncultured Caudovirales phage]